MKAKANKQTRFIPLPTSLATEGTPWEPIDHSCHIAFLHSSKSKSTAYPHLCSTTPLQPPLIPNLNHNDNGQCISSASYISSPPSLPPPIFALLHSPTPADTSCDHTSHSCQRSRQDDGRLSPFLLPIQIKSPGLIPNSAPDTASLACCFQSPQRKKKTCDNTKFSNSAIRRQEG